MLLRPPYLELILVQQININSHAATSEILVAFSSVADYKPSSKEFLAASSTHTGESWTSDVNYKHRVWISLPNYSQREKLARSRWADVIGPVQSTRLTETLFRTS